MIMRRPIIAGNWKMNLTPKEAVKLVDELIPLVKNAPCDVVVCPPFVDLGYVAPLLKGSNVHLGAQNVHWAASGAYTGEVSVDMLKEIGAEYVIVGHSERRQYFGETDKTVNLRARAALNGGLIPIICIGETLEQREECIADKVVSMQITAALEGMSANELTKLVVAYEPIWAIGTGKTATAEEANRTIGVVRNAVAAMYGKTEAEMLRIQYGGSMNPKNVAELMSMDEIDGGLIGGASLKADNFSKVVCYK